MANRLEPAGSAGASADASRTARLRAGAASDWLPVILLALGVVALALPVLTTPIPPLLDYPNHLARLWLEAGGAAEPPFDRIYAVDLASVRTNIGIDLLAAWVGPLLPIERFGQLLVLAAVVLPPLGAALLNRAVFRGSHWWQVGFPLLAWNWTLIAGFLNFQIGLGLALLAAAADAALSRRAGPAGMFLLRAAFAVLLLLTHAFAALFYAGLLAALALGGGWDFLLSRARLVQGAWRVALAVLPVALLVVLAGLSAPALPGAQEDPSTQTSWEGGFSLYHKLVTLFSAIGAHKAVYDVLCVGPFAVLALWALARRRLRVHAGLLLAAVAFLVLTFAVPPKVAGTYFVDARFPLMMVLTGAAALRPDLVAPAWPRRRAAEALLAGMLLVLVGARAAWVGSVWHERQADVAALRRALAPVEPGRAVLQVTHAMSGPARRTAPRGRYYGGSGPMLYEHLPALAVPWQHAFVPILFASRGKQPLRVLPPWDEIAGPDNTTAVSVHRLADAEHAALPPNTDYVRAWRTRFDYVLVLNADQPDSEGPVAIPAGLELVADEGFARLYRVHPPAGAAPGTTR
ncbi:hypothetical protein E0493_05760 [Roseomonas sp. M0104]|uniref:Uncharacterized protein n=1 Tax=Teichococcus coralli TaxID=2545983 RepID=A0A845B817_9PROT|nr:hypothetical protein [Pseudoroseomonas coralli]MXP62855.1 hypothetical protein [Pseudoroseomonas coralli]